MKKVCWWDTATPEQRETHVAAARARATKQMASPEARAAAAEYAHRGWEKSRKARFVMTDAIKERIRAANKGRPRKHSLDPVRHAAALAKQSASMRKRVETNPECLRIKDPAFHAIMIARSVAEGVTNPLRGKFEANCHARWWHLRSPQGVEYHFRNLLHFIREHAALFTEAQLSGSPRCPAYDNLTQLRPTLKGRVRQTALGWTWVLECEADPRNRHYYIQEEEE